MALKDIEVRRRCVRPAPDPKPLQAPIARYE
jgi:hypothetical protein